MRRKRRCPTPERAGPTREGMKIMVEEREDDIVTHFTFIDNTHLSMQLCYPSLFT
jgi:hypothetical protein